VSARGSADVSVDVSLPGGGAPGGGGGGSAPGGGGGAPGGGGGAPVRPPAPPAREQPTYNRGTGKDGKASLPDPVGELRFKVDVGHVASQSIGWFSECTGLVAEWDVFTYEEGGLNDFIHKFRGRAKYQNLVLKRGITYETALLAWFQMCNDHAERRDISVQLQGPDGKIVRSWQFVLAFPVKWQGPALNAGSNNVATETLEIAHMGFREA
jgi:phage tail-like protein